MGSERNQVYRCPLCGAVIEVMNGGFGELACCGKPMVLVRSGTTDGAVEKHVPVLEKNQQGVLVKVGSLPHPMEADHYIEYIEVINGTYVNRKYLKPGDKPEAAFYVPKQAGLVVREYCNKHGLWQADI